MRLKYLNKILKTKDYINEKINKAFYEFIRKLFCWKEKRNLIDEIACSVHWFLICLYIERQGKEFIYIKKIEWLIAKLIYFIKVYIYLNLLIKSQVEENEIAANKNLEEMRIYIWNLMQISFEFLIETMHLIVAIAENFNILL